MALHSTQSFQLVKALYLTKDGELFNARVTQFDQKDLPDGDVLPQFRVRHDVTT